LRKGLGEFLPAFFCLASALYGLWLVVQKPMLGYADNSDFWRVNQAAGLFETASAKTARWAYVQRHYRIGPVALDQAASSASIPAYLTSLPFRAVGRNRYDLRLLGIFYWLLFVAVLVWGRVRGMPWGILCFLCLLTFDSGCVLQANSFQSEPPMFVALLALVVFLFRSEARSRVSWLALFVIVGMATFSKVQFAFLPLLVVPFLFRQSRGVALAILVLMIPSCLFFLSPVGSPAIRGLEQMNNFNRVFYGVAVLSPDPKKAMAELEIPEKYWPNIGSHYLKPVARGPELDSILQEKGGVGPVASYFVRNPRAALAALGAIHETLPAASRSYVGNFEDRSRRPREKYQAWGGLSLYLDDFFQLAPRKVTAVFFWVLWLLPWLAMVPSVGAKYPIPREFWEPACFVSLFILTQLPVVILGDGAAGLSRHLCLARFGTNLLVAWYLGWALTAVKNALRHPSIVVVKPRLRS